MSRARHAVAIVVGALVGLGAAALAPLSVWRSRSYTISVQGKLLDEAAGPIEEVLFHYVPAAGPAIEAIYGSFLSSLDSGTRLLVLVPPPEEDVDPSDRLRRFLLSLPNGESLLARARIAVAGAPISPWSKDRALVAGGAVTELLVPSGPAGSTDQRLADWKTPMDLARAFPEELRARVLPLDFDAGDLAVVSGRLVVDANLLAKNAGRGLSSPKKLAELLERIFRMEVVVLGTRPGDVPRHHLSMYMAPLTDRVVLLGDPREGRRLVGDRFAPGETSPESGEQLVADFSDEVFARYDRAEADLRAAGFRVVHIPTVPFDDKTYFAYTNGVFETRGGRRIAWVPVFDLPALDQAALEVYRELGWEARPVPSRNVFRYHGTIGCLVNVLARAEVSESD